MLVRVILFKVIWEIQKGSVAGLRLVQIYSQGRGGQTIGIL